MKGIVRFGVSMDQALLSAFDKVLSKKGYKNRSEGIRDLIRDKLVEERWEEEREAVGVITLVYDHEVRALPEILTDLQHRFHTAMVSTLHVHLDEHNCLEVLVVRGMARKIRRIADRLISTKGVKHGKLTMTTTGRGLS